LIQQYSHKIIILIQQTVKLLCSYWHSHTKPRLSQYNHPPSSIPDWYSNLLCYHTPLIQQYLCHDLVIQQYSNYDTRIDIALIYTMLYHNNPPARILYLWHSNPHSDPHNDTTIYYDNIPLIIQKSTCPDTNTKAIHQIQHLSDITNTTVQLIHATCSKETIPPILTDNNIQR
jgi:hypothetical protein